MSTLNVGTITNGTESSTTQNIIQGVAKVWVKFNGTGVVAIDGSYNVASLTDNGTGDYTVNFTNVFTNGNYAIKYGGGPGRVLEDGGVPAAAGAYTMNTQSFQAANTDYSEISTSYHGDLT